MRFGMLPEGVLKDEDLKGSEKIVLAVLLFHRNRETGACYPGLKRIAAYSGLSRRTVQRSLASLEEKGRLKIVRRKSPEGDWETNNYEIGGWCQNDTTYGQSDTTWCQNDTRGGVKLTPGWCQNDAQTDYINKREEHKRPSVQNPLPQENKPALLHSNSIDNTHPSRSGLGSIGNKSALKGHLEKLEAAFAMFWAVYPKRRGKKEAQEVFSGLLPGMLGGERLNSRLQGILDQATVYAEEVKGAETRYIKNPANWLRSIDPDEAVMVTEEVWVRVEDEEE